LINRRKKCLSECTIYFPLIIFSFNCFFSRKIIIFTTEDLLSVDYIKIICQLTIFSYQDLLSIGKRNIETANLLTEKNLNK
jgi:hypothetical protein